MQHAELCSVNNHAMIPAGSGQSTRFPAVFQYMVARAFRPISGSSPHAFVIEALEATGS